jgi:predicted amidohydrolase YtcJ
MIRGPIKTCIAVFSLALSQVAAECQQAAPDLVLLNGKIFTSDAAHLYVQALAIRGERIAATGDSARIKALAGPHTKQIDLGGRTVIPGINDAHNHLGITPPNQIDLELASPDPTWTEMKAAITAAVVRAPKGTFISGTIAWKIFRDPSVDRNTLDQVAPDNPVILQTLTNHAWIMNSAALAQAGIREDQPDPLGGRFERATGGKLTGVIREYASFNVERTFSSALRAPNTRKLSSALVRLRCFCISTERFLRSASNCFSFKCALSHGIPKTESVLTMMGGKIVYDGT